MKGLFLRDGILFRRGFLPALILTLLTALLSFLAGYSVSRVAEGEKATVSVALVNQDASATGSIAVNAVREAPYVKGLLDMVDADEETALSGLREGRFQAVIVLPEGYIRQISRGVPGKGTLYLSESAASAGELLRAMVTFGELLLVVGQQGVFVGEDLILSHELSAEIHEKFLTQSNVALLEHAFSLFEYGSVVEVTDYAGSGLPLMQSYAVLFLSFFLLITGLFFVPLYVTDLKKGLLLRLYGSGLRPIQFLAGKVFYPFLYRLFFTIPMILLLSAAFPLRLNAGTVVLALLGLLVGTLMTTSGALLLGNRKGWPALFAGIFAVSLLLSGGIVPRAYLPRIATEIARFLPVGSVYGFLSPLFGGTLDLPSILTGGLLAVLLTSGALLFLNAFPKAGEDA